MTVYVFFAPHMQDSSATDAGLSFLQCHKCIHQLSLFSDCYTRTITSCCNQCSPKILTYSSIQPMTVVAALTIQITQFPLSHSLALFTYPGARYHQTKCPNNCSVYKIKMTYCFRVTSATPSIKLNPITRQLQVMPFSYLVISGFSWSLNCFI